MFGLPQRQPEIVYLSSVAGVVAVAHLYLVIVGYTGQFVLAKLHLLPRNKKPTLT